MRRQLLALTAGLGMLALTACGSTVAGSATGAAGSGALGSGAELGGGGELGGPGVPVGRDGPALGAGGVAAPGAGGGAGGGSSQVGGALAPVPGAGPAGAAPAAGAVGGKQAPMQVGITYFKDPGEGLRAIGVQGATLGDQKRYAQIVVDDVNKRGGLGGRKVVPVFFEYDANPGGSPIPQQDQEACATFVEDNKVELAIVNLAGENLNACLRKRGIPMITEGYISGDTEASLRANQLLFQVDGFNLDRRAIAHVSALQAQKWFTAWDNVNGRAGATPVKVGVVTYDQTSYLSSARGSLSSAVVAAGFAKPEVIAVAPHDSYDNVTRMSTQISAAVLSLKSAGVTHVIIWDDNGLATLFFLREAEQQSYRPRYGVNTGNNMQLLADGGLASPRQLNGMLGMGWAPVADIAEADSPTGKWGNAGRRQCDALMRKAEATGSGYNEGSALMYCIPMAVLKERYDRSPIRTGADFIAAMESLGASYQSPFTAATFLGPKQHDGVGGIYHYAYDSGCSCMRYTSSAIRLTS